MWFLLSWPQPWGSKLPGANAQEVLEPLAGAQPIFQHIFLSSLVFPEQSKQLWRRRLHKSRCFITRHCCSSARHWPHLERDESIPAFQRSSLELPT